MSRQQAYFNRVYRDAIELGCNHVQATLCATQSSLETGWGKYVKGNSYFGIKAGKSWKGKVIAFTTHEVIKGRRVKRIEKFRAYEDQRDSIRDYIATMKAKWPDAWNAKDIEQAARGLLTGVHGAYATDPDYMQDVWSTGLKRGRIARGEAPGSLVKAKPNLAKKGRPQQLPDVTRQVVKEHLSLIPEAHRSNRTFLLAVRGYFLDSKGRLQKNDRGIYDDAMFIVSPRGVWAYNANVDPSVYRKGVASYKSGQAVSFKQGIHGYSKPPSRRYEALEQVSRAKINRDQVGEDFGDYHMNIHRGSANGGTSSLGCVTIPYGAQWNDFYKRTCTEMDADGQDLIWMILLEYQGGKPPIKQSTTSGENPMNDFISRLLEPQTKAGVGGLLGSVVADQSGLLPQIWSLLQPLMAGTGMSNPLMLAFGAYLLWRLYFKKRPVEQE